MLALVAGDDAHPPDCAAAPVIALKKESADDADLL